MLAQNGHTDGKYEHPDLRDINRLSLLESFGCVRLVLWDETRRCLVPFDGR